MRNIEVSSDLPAKVDLTALMIELSALDSDIKAVYAPDQTWINEKEKTYSTSETITVMCVPDGVTDKQVTDVVKAHNPAEHKPYPEVEKALQEAAAEKAALLADVTVVISGLEARIEALEKA